MSNSDILKQAYFKWLTKEYEFNDLNNEFISISTPFIDNNFDNIEIFAKMYKLDDVDYVKLTDFGETLFNLEVNGININGRAKTKKSLFESTINSFGISFNEGNHELFIETTLDKFPLAKTRLLQAIMRINDLNYLSKKNIKTAFSEEVFDFLRAKDVVFTPSIEIPGKNGVSSYFDLAIPNNKKGERLVKTIARPNDINQAKIFYYDVTSVIGSRPNSLFIYLGNDIDDNRKIEDSKKNAALQDLPSSVARVLPFSEAIKNNDLLVNS
ncbi:DUF1828 domain-containing protein [Weissella paramesenteroides]|uniref:DUF1828 domain-containing protein n=1 Tax=Weissella paramesenteroides TaxID=1249 RepID=UPI00398390BD